MLKNDLLASSNSKVYRFAGMEVEIKAAKSDNVGQWSLIEYSVPAGFAGPALHYHKIMEEGFYIINGTATFSMNGQRLDVGPSSFVIVPPLTVHTFSNTTNQPFRMLVFMSPGGFEGYYEELQFLIKSEESWPPKDMSKMFKLLEHYDTYSIDS